MRDTNLCDTLYMPKAATKTGVCSWCKICRSLIVQILSASSAVLITAEAVLMTAEAVVEECLACNGVAA